MIVSAAAGLNESRLGRREKEEGGGGNDHHKQGIEDIVNGNDVGMCFTMKSKVAILTLIDKRFGSE